MSLVSARNNSFAIKMLIGPEKIRYNFWDIWHVSLQRLTMTFSSTKYSSGCLKKYAKFIKHKLKLVIPINNTYLLLDFAQSSSNFEPSFVETHQVLREIRLFEHEFQAINFSHLRIFEGMKFVKKTANRITTFQMHFPLKSKQE